MDATPSPPLIPPFDAVAVFVHPWTVDFPLYGWILLMGFLVGTACGLIGNYLVLRRMAMVGDAISHSVLPGLVLAFLLTRERQSLPMFVGAALAALLTTFLIELIHRHSRIKQDAAIGITFSTLFAVGVLLISAFADRVDLDQDCVLNGDLVFVAVSPPVTFQDLPIAPPAILRMALVLVLTVLLVLAAYKELLVTSFDPGLAAALGFRPGFVHYALMSWLALVVVSAFEAVGAILVIAMLILPGATASLLTDRLPRRLALTPVHAALASILGTHLSVWLDASPAGCMVMAGSGLFFIAWLLSPRAGLVGGWWRRRTATDLQPAASPAKVAAGG